MTFSRSQQTGALILLAFLLLLAACRACS